MTRRKTLAQRDATAWKVGLGLVAALGLLALWRATETQTPTQSGPLR